jgi:hypothetical protein
LEILNGLIQFTLFLMGKFTSKVEQIESRTASWKGLCSTFEGPLYSYLFRNVEKFKYIHFGSESLLLLPRIYKCVRVYCIPVVQMKPVHTMLWAEELKLLKVVTMCTEAHMPVNGKYFNGLYCRAQSNPPTSVL